MAFTFTDLNKLNINSLAEVISLTVGVAGEIQKGITVMNGIANNTPVVSVAAADKALRKSAGCGSAYKYDTITDNTKYYEHAPIELPIEICLQSLWGKMVAKGVKLSDDFSETELAGFIQSEIQKVVEADLLRLAWLDEDIKVGQEAGYKIFKNGGILKQLIAGGATVGALTLDDAGVLAALRGAIDAQEASQLDSSEFFVTSNVMRLYKNLLQDRGNSVAQVTMTDGKPEYYFEGYKINELRHVSSAAIADGAHDAFVVFTPKENIQLAMEAADVQIGRFIQDAKTRNYYSQTLFAASAMVVEVSFAQVWMHTAV